MKKDSIVVVVPTLERHVNIEFKQVNEDLFISNEYQQIQEIIMNNFELPVIGTCKLFQKYFKPNANIYIAIKYDPNKLSSATISVSTNYFTRNSFNRTNKIFQVSMNEAERLHNQQKTAYINNNPDNEQIVCVDMLITYDNNETKFALIPACISTEGFVGRMLQLFDMGKKYMKWIIPMVVGHGIVALFSYVRKGDPYYHMSMIASLTINKLISFIPDS